MRMTRVLVLCCMMVMQSVNVLAQSKGESYLKAHFAACLSRNEVIPVKKDKQLKLSSIEKYRKQVWQAWKQANEASAEEPLLSLGLLSEASVARWTLPDSLEPRAVMPYRYGVKEKGAVRSEYPFFIYLHGSGPKVQEWSTGLVLAQRFQDGPSAYFIPQIPNEGKYYRWWHKSKQFAWEKLLRLSLARGDVHPDSIYLFGISEGAYGSQRLASFYADYLAAAGPMAGGEPLKNAPAENCANLPFSLRTGDRDMDFYRNLLTLYTRQAFDSLQRLHPNLYTHRVELIPGRGHAIDYSPTTPWMKQFARQPYPRYFCWEDFDMDGRHRRGFYNLVVNQRPDEQARTRYEMTIDGNHVRLTVDNIRYEVLEKEPYWEIELKFRKHLTPATSGRFTLYFCEELLDLTKPVTIEVNGKCLFKGKLKPQLRHLVNSCATFYDPRRLYPTAVELAL